MDLYSMNEYVPSPKCSRNRSVLMLCVEKKLQEHGMEVDAEGTIDECKQSEPMVFQDKSYDYVWVIKKDICKELVNYYSDKFKKNN